jgi:hypothetical protein
MTAVCPRSDDTCCTPLGHYFLSSGRLVDRLNRDAHALSLRQAQRLLQYQLTRLVSRFHRDRHCH